MSGGNAEVPAGAITHRGIVNTPECDENGHMNVQFYWARFASADTQFRMMHGLDGTGGVNAVRLSRHVRYHAELKGAFGLYIVSRFAVDATGSIHILHQMIDADRGVISATALDQLLVSPTLAIEIRTRGEIEPVPANALPRSLKGSNQDFGLTEADWLGRGAVLTCRTAIEPHLTGNDGKLTDRGFVALSVEAAPASWSYGGFPQDVLMSLGLGRVALEKRLVINRRPGAGDLLHIFSRITAVERVTFCVRHHYFDSRTTAFIAACDVTLLPMDLTLRKGVALPEDVRARMQMLAAG